VIPIPVQAMRSVVPSHLPDPVAYPGILFGGGGGGFKKIRLGKGERKKGDLGGGPPCPGVGGGGLFW